jgi:microcystin-dependent protein
MAEPFLSEIRIMSFIFAPKGWALCNGQLLPINQNQALFSLLGTVYGGNGTVNFALPNLQGKTPIHVGGGHTLGETGGEQAHTLSISEVPTHVHSLSARSDALHHQRPPDVITHAVGIDFGVPLPGGKQLAGYGTERRSECRRLSGPPEHAAFPDVELLHCAARNLPIPDLKEKSMAQPYVGEIRMFAGNFPPNGWMFCEGQLLPISENETLFQLIGTTYGGDGQSTFALPDLRGRIPIHQGNGFIWPETGGAEEITLTVNQIPAHSHPMLASSDLTA